MDDAPPPFDLPPQDWAATPHTVQAVVRALVSVTATYQQQLVALQDKLAEQQDKLAQLQARLNQHSQNSSKLPSSDPPSAPPRPAKTPRGHARGAQDGHERNERPIPQPDQINQHCNYYPDTCPSCLHDISHNHHDVVEPQTQYVWQLPVIRPIISAHHYHTVCCMGCGALVTAPRPCQVPLGAFDARTAAIISLFHGCYRDSQREVQRLLSEVFGLPISLGSVANLQHDASYALAPVFDEVQTVVQAEGAVNVDETGWKEAGKRRWLWTLVSDAATLFRVTASRSAKTLRELIGVNYAGTITSDRGRWYMWLDDERHQLCWSHLIRNVRALGERYSGLREWADAFERLSGVMFGIWHCYRGGTIGRTELQLALEPIQAMMHALLEEGSRRSDAGAGLCGELLEHWQAL